jgi:hypothetical protein
MKWIIRQIVMRMMWHCIRITIEKMKVLEAHHEEKRLYMLMRLYNNWLISSVALSGSSRLNWSRCSKVGLSRSVRLLLGRGDEGLLRSSERLLLLGSREGLLLLGGRSEGVGQRGRSGRGGLVDWWGSSWVDGDAGADLVGSGRSGWTSAKKRSCSRCWARLLLESWASQWPLLVKCRAAWSALVGVGSRLLMATHHSGCWASRLRCLAGSIIKSIERLN